MSRPRVIAAVVRKVKLGRLDEAGERRAYWATRPPQSLWQRWKRSGGSGSTSRATPIDPSSASRSSDGSARGPALT
jgi:hypothetical protein